MCCAFSCNNSKMTSYSVRVSNPGSLVHLIKVLIDHHQNTSVHWTDHMNSGVFPGGPRPPPKKIERLWEQKIFGPSRVRPCVNLNEITQQF